MRVPIWMMIGTVMVLVAGMGAVAFATSNTAAAEPVAVLQPLSPTERLDQLNDNVQTLVDQLSSRDAEVYALRMELEDVSGWKSKIISAAKKQGVKTADAPGVMERKRRHNTVSAWGPVYKDSDEPVDVDYPAEAEDEYEEITEEEVIEIDRVAEVMYHYLKKAPRRELAQDEQMRWEFAQDIYTTAVEARVPHIFWTYQVYKESSYRLDASGDAGEIGLGQAHGRALKGCDMSTRLGQLSCCANWMALCFEKCGTWEGALTMYKSGHCSTSSQETRDIVTKRLDKWMELEAIY